MTAAPYPTKDKETDDQDMRTNKKKRLCEHGD